MYHYDKKDQLTELVHRDQDGILDRYTYLYDLLGNKTGITEERRGLEKESGSYAYGYDALGRLSEIQKDGQMQTRYGYDAFGNRTWKEESGERNSYQYNALNQMVSEGQGEIRKEYDYDKRGNLTSIVENGKCQKQYIYGALNRLEEAVNSVGKVARYQYNGLGHRVGKQEGLLPEEEIQKLDPQRRVEIEVGNFTQIQYTLDLTRQYHNLLERTEETHTQTYFWDGNVASYEENGKTNYYLQDELGSPLRIADGEGAIRESYGYGAFGEDLYQNQGKKQPFGYTGYQRDEIAGTYYAQAREYQTNMGRFMACDRIKGNTVFPITFNEYVYCYNNGMLYLDYNGCEAIINLDGIETHILLQRNLKLTNPNVETEFHIKGVGRADIVVQMGNGYEVYEIKPGSHAPGEKNISRNKNGKEQLGKYIDGLRAQNKMAWAGTSLNAQIQVTMLESKRHPNKMIKYYVYPTDPGMIYWNYINKPTKHPEPVRIPETEDDKSKNLETAGEIAVGAILLWGTYEVLKWSVAALTAAPTGGASLVAGRIILNYYNLMCTLVFVNS